MGGFGNGGPPSSSSSPSFLEGRGPPPPPPGRQPGDWTPFGGDEPPSSGGRPPPPPNGFPGGGFPGDGSPGGGPPSGGPPEGHFQGNFSSYPEDRRPIIYVEQPQSQPRSYKAHAPEPDRFSGKDPKKVQIFTIQCIIFFQNDVLAYPTDNEKSTPPSPIRRIGTRLDYSLPPYHSRSGLVNGLEYLRPGLTRNVRRQEHRSALPPGISKRLR